MLDEQRKKLLTAVKLLILDVDGVMTDGKLYFSPQGQQFKVFDTKDGHGIRLLLHYRIDVAVISGRESEATARRLDDLGVRQVYLGHRNKREPFNRLLVENNLSADQVAYMGDDLTDLSIMTKVGLACAVADAHPEVKKHAHWIADSRGGHGAVRELADLLLRAQGHWDKVLDHCLSEH